MCSLCQKFGYFLPHLKSCIHFGKNLATFWAIFSQTPPVTLVEKNGANCSLNRLKDAKGYGTLLFYPTLEPML
jgi:hypothetical protein